MPLLSVALYYYNFGRGITPENRHLLIYRMKNMAQIIVILWFPLLINWPSVHCRITQGITFYILCNAIYSVFQTRLLSTMWFMKKVNPKLMVLQLMLRSSEFDEKSSQALVDAIKQGEESYAAEATEEEELVEQTKKMLEEVRKEKNEELCYAKFRNMFGL